MAVLLSFVEEYGILLIRFVVTLILTIVIGITKSVFYGGQKLVEMIVNTL
jgi:uncharacterized membrane protein YraQ (UPF0718 family)